MKPFFIIVLVMMNSAVIAQEIAERSFDRFDSIQKIVTTDMSLGAPNLSDYTAPNIYVKVAKYAIIKNGTPSVENLSLYVIIHLPYASVFDNETSFKVIFEDGVVRTYKNEASYKVWGKDESATIYFTIPVKDRLRTKSIKAAKISSSNYSLEVDTNEGSKDRVKKMIALVNQG